MIVYEDDQDWKDIKIDNKQVKSNSPVSKRIKNRSLDECIQVDKIVIIEEKAELKSGEEWRCPICREVKTTESALPYHLRQTHKKKRQGTRLDLNLYIQTFQRLKTWSKLEKMKIKVKSVV